MPGVANFSLTYADGTYISGNSGFDDVTLAGMTIKKQQILMTTEASWSGDTITSGLLGLSYPLETRLFNVSTPDQNYVGSPTHRRYDPVFTNMFKQGLVSPSFSMAMNRTAQKGWLAFGGLPPVDHDPNFAKTRIRVASTIGRCDAGRADANTGSALLRSVLTIAPPPRRRTLTTRLFPTDSYTEG